jgi:hypothetical protein
MFILALFISFKDKHSLVFYKVEIFTKNCLDYYFCEMLTDQGAIETITTQIFLWNCKLVTLLGVERPDFKKSS